jgi:hypothetical protein
MRLFTSKSFGSLLFKFIKELKNKIKGTIPKARENGLTKSFKVGMVG